jgi:inward rectifier potassium channel
MYSQGTWANGVVVAESFISLLGMAVLTGIVFAKFSRPRARVLFAERPVIETRDGVRTLSFRVANERGNDVVEAAIRVSALMSVITSEGKRLRRFHDLELTRSSTPLFVLTWQVFHAIDESSPLHGMTVEDMVEGDVRLGAALTGLDGTFAQTIHARHLYWAEDLLEGHHYVDVLEPHEDGSVTMDFRKFHDTVAEAE